MFDTDEKYQLFNKYASKNWLRKDAYSENIYMPYMENIPEYNMDAFREEYRNVHILMKMLEEFRRTCEKKHHLHQNIVNSAGSWERMFLASLHFAPQAVFLCQIDV